MLYQDMSKSDQIQELSILNIKKHLHGTFSYSSTYELGIQLGLALCTLDTFKADCAYNSERMFIEVIAYWLNNDVDKSWCKLADALEACSYHVLAATIRDKEIQSSKVHTEKLQAEASVTKPGVFSSCSTKTLSISDHHKVTKEIRNLSDENLISLGGSLGLLYPHMKKMKNILFDLVEAWLNEEDNVKQPPSWSILVSSLKEIGQNGLARTIAESISHKRFVSHYSW